MKISYKQLKAIIKLLVTAAKLGEVDEREEVSNRLFDLIMADGSISGQECNLLTNLI